MVTPRHSNLKFAAQAGSILLLEAVFFGLFTPYFMSHRATLAPVMRVVLLGCAGVYVVVLAILLAILVRKRRRQAGTGGLP